MTKFTETVPLSILDGSDGLLLVVFDFVAGSPETPPAYAHGGLPADPPEFDVLEARYVREDGSVLQVPVLLPEHEKAAIIEYLAENWAPPDGPDPDDWRDQQRDEELTR